MDTPSSDSCRMTGPDAVDFHGYTKSLCQSFLLSSLNPDDRRGLLFGTELLTPEKVENDKLVTILITLAKEFDERFARTSATEVAMKQFDLMNDENPEHVKEMYVEVLNGMFRKTNWGRIVAMLAFLRMLALNLIKRGRHSEVEGLIESTASYCNERLRCWIQLHGGWHGLVDFFRSNTPRTDCSRLEASNAKGNDSSTVMQNLTLGVAAGAMGAICMVVLGALWARR